VNVTGRELFPVQSRSRRVAVTVLLIPNAVDTVTWTPGDGWIYHPKYIERFTDINKPYRVASYWTIIGIYFKMHSCARHVLFIECTKVRIRCLGLPPVTQRSYNVLWKFSPGAGKGRERKDTQLGCNKKLLSFLKKENYNNMLCRFKNWGSSHSLWETFQLSFIKKFRTTLFVISFLLRQKCRQLFQAGTEMLTPVVKRDVKRYRRI